MERRDVKSYCALNQFQENVIEDGTGLEKARKKKM